jgi:hypothetical protein
MANQNVVRAGVLQNLSGEFKATFTSETIAGEARFPFHSQTIRSSLGNVAEFLEFNCHSGETLIQQSITNDDRSIQIILKSDLAPGTYVFPPDGAIKNVTYSEVQKVGTSYHTQTYTATKAELELSITQDRRRYTGLLKFEVLINGETLKINSSFDVVLHFSNSSAEQQGASAASLRNDNTSVAMPENITGEFNARFFTDPGETSTARAPYHSASLSYDSSFMTPDINFHSRSGTRFQDIDRTSDERGLEIHLKKGITSGTYHYPGPLSPITHLQYSEIRRVGNRYIYWNLEILEAALELEVIDERRYVSKQLSIKTRTPTGAILYIKADFDIYLAWD